MLKIIHNLGGCGGTLLARCLGVLPQVVVFSEIHPGAVKLFPHFDPLYQDRNWHGLLSAEDQARFASLDLREVESFSSLVAAFHQAAEGTGRHLVLRDWTYLDFCAVPFTEPSHRLTLYDALPPGVPVRSVAFVRHPIDQWVSLCKHVELVPALTAERFCSAWLAFMTAVSHLPVYRYEQFAAQPQAELEGMCRDLELPFDATFVHRFSGFDSVTGDFARIRDTRIEAPPSREVAPELRRQLQPAVDAYTRAGADSSSRICSSDRVTDHSG